ncbi:phosphoribosylglycinamide synthetase [Neisseria wadsworthii]|uniref:phosphoribosylglycinamide synthetase n=1 Tax=Neisseria wadsworthii TaxID=607711 RepID=UPI000D2F75AE|nr:phosphoribosylglycinamide synthetase [Neisseria wadsworthii]
MRFKYLTVFTFIVAFLAACQKEEAPQTPQSQAEQQAPVQQPQPAPVSTAPVSTETTPASQAGQGNGQPWQSIQTKIAGPGSIHLVKAKATGKILSVEFIAEPPKKPDGEYEFVANGITANAADFYYIDEFTSKKVHLLQDESGKYMASPLEQRADGEAIKVLNLVSHPQTVSLKFPAPPETSPTVTIEFPGIGSFDSVPVQR